MVRVVLHFGPFWLCGGFHYPLWQCSCIFTSMMSSCYTTQSNFSCLHGPYLHLHTWFGAPDLPCEPFCCLEASCGEVGELPAPELQPQGSHKEKKHKEKKDITLCSTDWQMVLWQTSAPQYLSASLHQFRAVKSSISVTAKTIWGVQNLSMKFWSGQVAQSLTCLSFLPVKCWYHKKKNIADSIGTLLSNLSSFTFDTVGCLSSLDSW